MNYNDTINGRDLYIRLHNPACMDRSSDIINHHRVWDASLFIASQHDAYDTKAKPGERRIVTPATVEEYRASR